MEVISLKAGEESGQSQGQGRTLTAQQPRREVSRQACAALLLIETLRSPGAYLGPRSVLIHGALSEMVENL